MKKNNQESGVKTKCNYHECEQFFPLPVGEFRWHFKHLSDKNKK